MKNKSLVKDPSVSGVFRQLVLLRLENSICEEDYIQIRNRMDKQEVLAEVETQYA